MSDSQRPAVKAVSDPSGRYCTYGSPGTTEAVWTAATIALLDELLGFDEDA